MDLVCSYHPYNFYYPYCFYHPCCVCFCSYYSYCSYDPSYSHNSHHLRFRWRNCKTFGDKANGSDRPRLRSIGGLILASAFPYILLLLPKSLPSCSFANLSSNCRTSLRTLSISPDLPILPPYCFLYPHSAYFPHYPYNLFSR